jgi:sulfate-transporting ATPase
MPKRSSVNWNGCARMPRAVRPRARRVWLAYEELASKEFQKRNETQEIYIPPGERLGDQGGRCEKHRKSFGDRLLYENVNFTVPKGAIVGIIGPNGAGKTTLFRMITGEQKPDAGEVVVGDSVKVAYVGQIPRHAG